LVSAIIASLKGESALVLGNVIGSNVANITLIVGGAAVLRAMPIEKVMLERDGYLALSAAVLLLLFALNGVVSAFEGMVFFLLFVAYSVFLVQTSQDYQKAYHIRQFAQYFFRFGFITGPADSLRKSVRRTKESKSDESEVKESFDWRNFTTLLLSVFLIVLGGNFLVGEAVFFSNYFGLPVTLVGVILALGTTAPEMSVSIAATRQGMGGMVIGNAIGSVLCNTFLILGVASLISPISVSLLALKFAIPFLLGVTAILLVFKRSNHEIRRIEGVGLCLLYLAFIGGYALLA
jgi:cation:H+ antiporter